MAWYLMCSWLRAAAVADCCELVISVWSCWVTCCCDCPGAKISLSGTTASCGSSQARSAVNTLNP